MPTLLEDLYTYFVLTITPGVEEIELKNTQLAFWCPGPMRETVHPVFWVNSVPECGGR